MRGATLDFLATVFKKVISIHAPRERSDILKFEYNDMESISIHAPRERSDASNSNTNVSMMGISIHAPRERSDLHMGLLTKIPQGFQSTLLVRGATGLDKAHRIVLQISIHAPRERSDVP